MGIFELFFLAFGLSMDAFAVSVCKGLASKDKIMKTGFVTGLYFGVFQAMMPVIGYFLGIQFQKQITAFDHWIALILLSIIGGKMIKESFDKEKCDKDSGSINVSKMLPMAIATSIDALAIGITFAITGVDIAPAAGLIGIITFIFSFAGVKIGNIFGTKYKSRAELAGGIILILIGLNILFKHLEIIKF